MNSLQIEKILTKNRITKNYFTGVYSSNNIPKFASYPHCFVANTDRVGTRGTHWVAFYVNSPGVIEFFDSLGNLPNDDFQKYLKQLYGAVITNDISLQSPFSDACGYFCIYFLLHRCKGYTFDSIIQKLKNKSDNYVKAFVSLFVKMSIKGNN